MTLTRKITVPLLAGLLVAALVGMSPGGDSAIAAPQARTGGKIMIAAASFIPTTDNWDYSNNGYSLATTGNSGNFTAPIPFPVPVVNIKKIILYAYDNGAGSVCATVYRASPPTGNELNLGAVCTTDQVAYPQDPSTSAISPRRANTALVGPYLWVTVPEEAQFFGVSVLYSY
ncbi:MAG: hypothetical protein ABIJ48_06970 [Actinomycetota bacterium]